MIQQEWTNGHYEVVSKIVEEPELRFLETHPRDEEVLSHFQPDTVRVEWMTVDDVWMLHTVTIGGARVLRSGQLGKQRDSRTWYERALELGEPPAWVLEHVASLTGPPTTGV
jgi:hypothetical protein